jgi:hypothetical protein
LGPLLQLSQLDQFGFVSGTSTSVTLTGGDQINGGAGNDSLNITIDTNTTANTTQTPALTAVETVSVRNLAANTQILNLVQATGVTSVVTNNSLAGGTLSVTNAPLAATYGVTNSPADAASNATGVSVTFSSADILGTADTANFSVTSAGSKVGNAASKPAALAIANTSAVEAVSVATSGTNYIKVGGAGTDTKSVTITGAGVNEIALDTTLNSTLTLDASTSTGTNTFSLGSSLTSSDVVKGGSGSDTLVVALGSASGVSVTGVETLRISQGSTDAANLSFAANPAFTTIEVRDSDEAETAILTGITTGTTLAFVGADTGTTNATFTKGLATNDVSFTKVQLNTAMAGTADTLNVNLGNQGVTAATGYTANVKGSGIETVNFTQSDIYSSARSTLTLTDTGAKTITATSAGGVDLTFEGRASQAPNAAAYTSTTVTETHGNTVTLIDFSGVTGTATLTIGGVQTGVFAAAAELKTAIGGMSYTFGTETATDVITVTGNAGADVIVTGDIGTYKANLGAGNDQFNANAIGTAGNGTVTVDGGAGDDTITGGINADTLSGGDGADTLVGGKGADILSGNAGSDTYTFAAGTAAVSATNQISTLTPFDLELGETLNVTIGGTTYSQVFRTDVATTLADFVANSGGVIRGATGGSDKGVVVSTTNGQLVFTGQGTAVDSTTGAGTNATFTAPTATVTGLDGGKVVASLRDTGGKSFTPDASWGATGETHVITATPATGTAIDYTLTWQVSTASSLQAFAAANPTIGGFTVVATDTTLLFQTTGRTAPTVSTLTAVAGPTGVAGPGAIGNVTNTTTTIVTGINSAVSAVSDSGYKVTGSGASAVVTSTIDQVTFENGDKIDIGSTAISTTEVAGAAGRAAISSTGLATFTGTPGDLNAALAQISAGINASGAGAGATAAGEAALFQFGGKTYVYIEDGINGHTQTDLVIEIVGAPTTLTAGLSLSSGAGADIINIG